MRQDTTDAATIRHFRSYCRYLGVPVLVKTDGGLHFSSRTLEEFVARRGVRHNVTSPHWKCDRRTA